MAMVLTAMTIKSMFYLYLDAWDAARKRHLRHKRVDSQAQSSD
jgi:hypothetical protein